MASLGATASSAAVSRVREEESTDCDDDVYHDAQHALQVVGFTVAQERAHHEYGEDQRNGVEDDKVVVHVLNVQAPADKNNERCVEQSGLDRRTHDVSHCHVDLVVVCFVNSEQMFWVTLDSTQTR